MSDARKPDAMPGRILGSLKDALLAAGRSDGTTGMPPERLAAEPILPKPPELALAETRIVRRDVPPAAEAAREAKMQTARVENPTQRARPPAAPLGNRTQLVRGRVEVARGEFHQDPVVGWLVVVGGPGLGAFRPIYEGNNTVGRGKSQRIPIDFGDDSISSDEQAYIRYDSVDRSFLFVPNLAKTNVVSVNAKKPTGAVPLASMDVITMGRTQLAFVPFCGDDFDWAELGEPKS
jgi:hypothetical protein